jgi:hypothetical protein
MFVLSACDEDNKNRDQPNRIDGDKNRNKGEEEFFNHTVMAGIFALPEKRSTQCSLPSSIKPFRMKPLCLSILLSLAVVHLSVAETKAVDDFRAAAAKANAVLTIPEWEQTPEAIEASVKDADRQGEHRLDRIGAQDLGKVTFKSTVAALDDLTYCEPATQRTTKQPLSKKQIQMPPCAAPLKMRKGVSKTGRSELIIARTFTRRLRLRRYPSQALRLRR